MSKLLPQRHEYLSSTAKIHIKKASVVVRACSPNVGKWRQVDAQGSLASQPPESVSSRFTKQGEGDEAAPQAWTSSTRPDNYSSALETHVAKREKEPTPKAVLCPLHMRAHTHA